MPVQPGQSPNAIALRKRLASGRLLPQDEERMAFAARIREGRAQGDTFAQCAARLGVPVKRVQEFANGQIYDAIVTHLERHEGGQDHQAARDRMKKLVPKALDRLAAALDEGITADGRLIESRRADRAMELVLDAAGLLEAEHGGRPPVVIDTLVIQQITDTIREDERRIAAARVIPVEAHGQDAARWPAPVIDTDHA